MKFASFPGQRRRPTQQKGMGLVQTVLALLVFTGVMAASIQLLVRWGQQSRGELQAQKLLVVQASVQRFIQAHQAALLVSAADAPFVPYVDANGDGVADVISYTTLSGQNYGQLNLTGAAGTTLALARAINSLPAGVSFSWNFDANVLQNTPVAWLKPGSYAVLDGLADPVAITLSVDQATHRIRGLACLSGTAIRDGAVDARALQAVLAYRAPAAEPGTSALLAVSLDGQLRNAAGPIDLARMQVAFPGAPAGPVPDGKVCAMVGDWPATISAGVATPQRISSANIASSTHFCAYPGETRWVYNTARPPVTQGLQLCGSNYQWLPPAKVGDGCMSANLYTHLGRDSTNLQPVHLQCNNSLWEQRQTLRVAREGDLCSTDGASSLSEVHAVDSNGKTLYCQWISGRLSYNPNVTTWQSNPVDVAPSGQRFTVFYVHTNISDYGKGSIGCVSTNPACVKGLDLQADMACAPDGGIFIYRYPDFSDRRIGICKDFGSGPKIVIKFLQ
ncbi:MAG: hypothetical protein RLZZ123_271 [Pseudomonadota bacterium]